MRECKQAIISSVKNRNYETLQETRAFDRTVQNSYMKLLYHHLKSHQFEKKNDFAVNGSYMNQLVLTGTSSDSQKKQALHLNLDFKVVQPANSETFAYRPNKRSDLLGLLNSPLYLHLQALEMRLLHKLQSSFLSEEDGGSSSGTGEGPEDADLLGQLVEQFGQAAKEYGGHASDLLNYSCFQFIKTPRELQQFESGKDLQSALL